jgi:hypothetical protein
MSALKTIRTDIAKYADPVMRVLELVQSLTGVGGPKTAAALEVVAAAMKTLEQGVVDKLTPAMILANLDALTAGEAADDAAAAAANAAELAKYPGGA